jgi:opacity protein-like surface antigen
MPCLLCLAQLALRLPGAIVEKFDRAMDRYAEAGFELEPRFLIRAMIAIGTGQSRFKFLTEFWQKSPEELERIWGRTQKADLDAVLAAVSLRLLFPESPAALQAERSDYRTEGRFYLGLRLGGATPVHGRIADDLEARPANNAIGGTLGHLFGVVLGTDLTRHLGVELALEGFEPRLAIPNLGSVAEYGLYVVTPQVRLRYPVLGGRLVPYILGGAGVSWGEVNDIKPHGFNLNIKGEDYAPVGMLGIGAEYFVARNIAVGLELKYMISRGHSITVAGRTQHMNLDSILTFLGVRIFFGKGTGDAP